MKVTKKPVWHDRLAYQTELNHYNQDQEVVKSLNAEYTKLTGKEFIKDPQKELQEHFDSLASNVMKLPYKKYCGLMEIDLTKFNNLVSQWRSLEKPAVEAHTVYAETPEEIERLKAFQNLKDAFAKWCEISELNPLTIRQSLGHTAFFDHDQQDVFPSLHVIKKRQRRV